MPLDISTTLADRYRLEREIGAGGMATVYAARDMRHDRSVAVKVLRPELASAIGGERFLREIAIVARLQHPHIVGLIDSGIADELPYYVMPLIHGKSLRDRLSEEGELPLEDGLRILRQVLDALAYAHRQGFVHRDIKPENVLLSGYTPRVGGANGRWHAMVADFGIAKAVTEAGGDPLLTGTGMSVGTPASMSPEQAAGDPRIDHRSDLYALGVLAYEIFVGVPPFAGSTPQQIIAAHMTRAPQSPSSQRPAISRDLDGFILRCLEKNPADRWQTADDALARLEAIAAADSWKATGRSPAPQAAEVVKQRFRLTEGVCRQLDRATLDPRTIGAEMQYSDNQLESDVLLVLLHGTGQDESVFRELMEALPYRCLAPTLIGFEPSDRNGLALPLATHIGIVRAFISDAASRLKPSRTVIVGFSSGADVAFLLASRPGADFAQIDGIVSLGGNISFETCFVTKLWSRLGSGDETQMLSDLQRFGTGARTLEEWLKINEYLVSTFRKFDFDLGAVRVFSQEIVHVFENDADDAFVRLFRESNEHVTALRCVWEDSDLCTRLVQALRMRNLDSGVLGGRYREDALHIELGFGHFDLLDPKRVKKHVSDVLTIAASVAEPRPGVAGAKN
ncbi:MAG: alpha/beta fold hydrolase [Gemmatimonadaceae bacterium]